MVVGLLWCAVGAPVTRATLAFTLALAVVLAACFFGTIAPAHYTKVTCDNLSLGFFAPALTGALTLAIAAGLVGSRPLAVRLAALAVVGAAVATVTLTVAPQCLGNPLSTMDPLLLDLWLSGIQEAQPITGILARQPTELGTFYAVGLVALIVCLWRIARRDRLGQHLILLPCLLTAYGVTLIQIRGILFVDILAIITLAPAIAELRAWSNAEPKKIGRGLAFAGLTLASMSPVWALVGMGLSAATSGTPTATADAVASSRLACGAASNFASISKAPPTVVFAASELGVSLLRYTPHRVLTAPYHRNQAGMLAELQIGMTPPAAAEQRLQDLGVTIVAFCPTDTQTQKLIARAPDGLYAHLQRNEIPAYLEPIPQPDGASLKLFRLKPV